MEAHEVLWRSATAVLPAFIFSGGILGILLVGAYLVWGRPRPEVHLPEFHKEEEEK